MNTNEDEKPKNESTKVQICEKYKKQVNQAIDLLVKIINENLDIELPAWASAFASLQIKFCLHGEVSYEDFCKEMDRLKTFYKTFLEEPKNG